MHVNECMLYYVSKKYHRHMTIYKKKYICELNVHQLVLFNYCTQMTIIFLNFCICSYNIVRHVHSLQLPFDSMYVFFSLKKQSTYLCSKTLAHTHDNTPQLPLPSKCSVVSTPFCLKRKGKSLFLLLQLSRKSNSPPATTKPSTITP